MCTYIYLPFLSIPTSKHFCRRQYRHLFLVSVSISQCLFLLHVYIAVARMLLLKKLLQASQLNTPKCFPVEISLQTRQSCCSELCSGQVGNKVDWHSSYSGGNWEIWVTEVFVNLLCVCGSATAKLPVELLQAYPTLNPKLDSILESWTMPMVLQFHSYLWGSVLLVIIDEFQKSVGEICVIATTWNLQPSCSVPVAINI